MRARGKPGNVTVVACSRELSCFLWAAATANGTPPRHLPVGQPGRRATGGRHARSFYEQPDQHRLGSRSVLDSARRQHEQRALGSPIPASPAGRGVRLA
jgi:hypothetical protein